MTVLVYKPTRKEPDLTILISLIVIVLATLIIARVCDGFEAAADYLGRNLSEGVKGATINAIGSSMPELFTTLVFLFIFFDTSGFAGGIGTTAGSAVFNTMIIPAVSVIAAIRMFKIATVNVSKKVVLRDGLMLIAVEFILIVTITDTLRWWHGLMFMLLYAGYVGYMLASMKANGKAETDNDDGDHADGREEDANQSRIGALFTLDLEYAVVGNKTLTTGNAWMLLTAATIGIAIGSWLLVYGCETLGHTLGIKGYFVAVVMAAAATSIPDTILSVRDARKGNYDDAVSNALGSNIFDICFALGLPLFLYTIIFGDIVMSSDTVDHITELRVLLLILTVVAFFIFLLGKGIDIIKSVVLLSIYLFFIIYIITRAYDIGWFQPLADLMLAFRELI